MTSEKNKYCIPYVYIHTRISYSEEEKNIPEQKKIQLIATEMES